MALFVLQHGGSQGHWVWEETAALLLARGHRSILPDVPGCGAKRWRDCAAMPFDAIVAELAAEIDAAEPHAAGAILVGHSQGGTLIAELAAARPERFRHLVFLASGAPVQGTTMPEMIGDKPRGHDPERIGLPLDPATTDRMALRDIMFCNDMDEAFKPTYFARSRGHRWPAAAQEKRDWRYDHLAAFPSTYIVCEQDNILPVEWQLRFAERFHCKQTARIDAGHQAMLTQPDALVDLLAAIAAA